MGHLKPSFFIVGERKCGTSSLYRYLLEHPNVLPCKVKEPQFFTQHPLKVWWNINQYFQLFPDPEDKEEITLNWPELDASGALYQEKINYPVDPNQSYITGEASANTFYQAKPARIKRYLPDIKLVVMVRNPVDRAYSHYRMIQRFKEEGRLTRKLKGFEADMMEEMNAARTGKKTDFIGPGMYIEQFKKWTKVFPLEQMFVIRMEDLVNLPTEEVGANKGEEIMTELCKFLELPPFDFGDILKKRYNVAPVASFPMHFRSDLAWFYRPYNLVLEDFLGRPLKWDQ